MKTSSFIYLYAFLSMNLWESHVLHCFLFFYEDAVALTDFADVQRVLWIILSNISLGFEAMLRGC